jgi:hypothetical protein
VGVELGELRRVEGVRAGDILRWRWRWIGWSGVEWSGVEMRDILVLIGIEWSVMDRDRDGRH